MENFRRRSFHLLFSVFVTVCSCGHDSDSGFSPAATTSTDGKAGTEEIFGWIEDLCAMGYRRPGTEAEHQAEQYIADKFVEFGLEDVHLEPMDITLWNAEEWGLNVKGEEVPSFYVPFSAFTPPSGVTAEILYLGEGSKADFARKDAQGKIVVVDIRSAQLQHIGLPIIEHTFTWVLTNWDAYDRAVENQALGFVGILKDYWDLNTYYAPADNPSKPFEKRTLPGLWVSRTDGNRILQLLKDETAVQATLELTGTTEPAVTSNVVGFLPGQTDEIIMVHTHHDAPFHGAVEDASGVAEVLSLAKYFGQLPKWSRKKTLLFLTATGHFYNYLGNATFVERHKDDLIPRILVDVCIEHIAQDFDEVDGEIVDTGRPEQTYVFATGLLPTVFALTAIKKYDLERTVVLPWPAWPVAEMVTDALDYHEAGIPLVSLITAPEYLYDLIDTPDKVAKDMLLPVSEAFIDIVEMFDTAPADWIGTW